jgi:hypothetical protein
MTAISAAAMRVRTMADGSLRIEVEVEPNDAQEAFAMFGRPGTPMALAALKDGYASQDDKNREMREKLDEMPVAKGGALAKLAGQWCEMPEFHRWLADHFAYAWRKAAEDLNHPSALRPPEPEEVAAEVIRRHCGIASRAALDHNEQARQQFDGAIRRPFSDHLRSA